MSFWEFGKDGLILRVRVHPAARRNEIRGVHADELSVAVTQAPDKGKANKAVLELLAKVLDVKKSQIELVSGTTTPSKRFLIRGYPEVDWIERLAALAPPAD